VPGLLQEQRQTGAMMKAVSTLIFLLAAAIGNGCSSSTQEPEPEPPSALRVETVATGLASPVFLTAPANDQRLFVVEQAGRIRIIQNGQLAETSFLDIRARVGSGGERGLLSMAFHPNYATNGFFFVNFTDLAGNTRVERFTVTVGSPNVANAASAKLIIGIDQPFTNHNGGQLQFGPDGKLYIGMGDGGSGGDPLNHGQDRTTLLGDLLRIDIDAGDPYAIPADNPYATSAQFRREIWAYGLRNPWRFSFDRTDGVIYIADVGQNLFEEVNAVPAAQAGVNYGWRIMEAAHCYPTGSNCTTTGLQQPVHEYSHNDGCSVTGGYVYRGSRIPGIVGHYFYSDFCTGFLKSFKLVNGSATDHRTWSIGDIGSVMSFGQDASGELYMLTSNGRVSRIIP
jgi:glucose/arabinose dehydrogenase